MVQSIPIPGLAANDPVGGLYVQTAFAQGAATGSGALRKILLMGNKLSSGLGSVDVLYGPDTPVQILSQSDAESQLGLGSELTRQYINAAQNNPASPIYVIAVAEAAGAQASRKISISGTATSSGVIRFWSGTDFIDTAFVVGDGYADIAENVANNINAQGNWAVSGTFDIHGGVTTTAKQIGERGNDLRCGMQAIPASVGISVSSSAFDFLSGGSGADNNSAALAVIAPQNFYYIVSAAGDSVNFGRLSQQVSTEAQPIDGNRQRCFAADNHSLSDAITVATGINNVRAEYVWLEESDLEPPCLTAQAASSYAFLESSTVPVMNFNFYGQQAGSVWDVPAPLSGSAPTRAELQSALNNGVTPIGVGSHGNTWIERRITTYSLNGVVQDYRVRDASQVTIVDFYADDLTAIVAPVMAAKNIGNDPVNQNITVPENVMCPRDLKAIANRLTRQYANNGLIDDVDNVIANTVAIREVNPDDRLSLYVPLFVSRIVNSIGVKLAQV